MSAQGSRAKNCERILLELQERDRFVYSNLNCLSLLVTKLVYGEDSPDRLPH